MKVKDLIKELNRFYGELEIRRDYDDYAGDIHRVELGFMTTDGVYLISPPKPDSIKIVVIS